MAPGAGALCVFLLCILAVINAETKQANRLSRALVNNLHNYHSASSKHSGHGHSYPSSHGYSGTRSTVTRAPHTTHIPRARAPEVHSYPPSGGGSGSGYKPPPQPGTSRPHTYGPSNTGSGSGYKPPQQPGTSRPHTYPPSNTGSGSGYKPPQQPGTSRPHTYPPSNTGSGSGHQHPKQPAPTQGLGFGAYPHPTRHPGNAGYVYIRNQQKIIHMTNIHIYNYRPPQRISYPGLGTHRYYPVYSGVLPDYVYTYRSSQSRYRKLLAGLALYNFGMLSQNSDSYRYHEHYSPSPNEICKFGVRRYDGTYEEVDIDCRLITYFIWSENNHPLMPGPTTTEVVNALDPKFYGAPIQIKPSMKCYIKWGHSFASTRVGDVDCGLLQTYVDRSFNSATKITTIFLVVVASFVVLLLG